MTMAQQKYKKRFWDKVKHFFWQFDMCKCSAPKYEVLNGVLSCGVCGKATKWENQPK